MAQTTLALEVPLSIEFQRVLLSATVGNVSQMADGRVRVGLVWDHSLSPVAAHSGNHDHEAPVISIESCDHGGIALEQAQGHLWNRIIVDETQLKEIIEFLALLPALSHVVGVSGGDDIQIRVVAADNSFRITQGANQLVGVGDIRHVLQSVSLG